MFTAQESAKRGSTASIKRWLLTPPYINLVQRVVQTKGEYEVSSIRKGKWQAHTMQGIKPSEVFEILKASQGSGTAAILL